MKEHIAATNLTVVDLTVKFQKDATYAEIFAEMKKVSEPYNWEEKIKPKGTNKESRLVSLRLKSLRI